MRSAPPPHRPDYVAGYVFTHASRIPSPPLMHLCPIGNQRLLTSRTKPSHSRYQPNAAAAHPNAAAAPPNAAAVPTGRDSPDVSRGNTSSHIATTRHAPQDRSSVTAPMTAQTDERSAIAQHVPGTCVLWHAPRASRLPQAIQHTIALPATTRNSALVCSFGCYDAHNRRQSRDLTKEGDVSLRLRPGMRRCVPPASCVPASWPESFPAAFWTVPVCRLTCGLT